MSRGKIGLIRKIWILVLMSLFPMISSAEYTFEFIPRISVSEVYDDNIYLQSADEKSDYITTVSPGLSFTMSSQNNSLSLDYSPTWVRYDDEDQNDTVRHSGTLTFGQDLTEYLRFDLSDSYLKSEEPVEETEAVQGIRRTRNTYQRNTGSGSFRYRFGPENALTFGYMHSLLENEDLTIDDGTIQNPFATINYWFSVKNGLELDYVFTKANFSRDDDAVAGDDYDGHAAGIRFIHRLTTQMRGSLSYRFTKRDFDGLTEDYKVHDGSVGFERAFSPDLSLSLGAGYYTQELELSNDQTGYTYNASLTKQLQRGRVSLGGRSGWDEAYLEAERRGFTRYWSADARFQYQLTESLNTYAGGSVRRDRDAEDLEWQTWRGNCGLNLEFFRWFSVAFDYTYLKRDGDDDTLDYRDNRVMLMLTGRKPYRW